MIYTVVTQIPTLIVNNDKDQFTKVCLILLVVYAIVCLSVFAIFFSASYLALDWRKTLTIHIHQRYIAARMYYNMNCVDKTIDNP
jgi:ATP-binding cassette subfamily D (ALD) protein 4